MTPWELPAQDTLDDQKKAEKVFLQLLDQYTANEREVNDRHKRYYAPKCFAQEADRLFTVGVIRIETYGRVNRPDRRIVRAA